MKLDLADLEGVRLLANYADAERCLHIYLNPLSQARPSLAWLALPLGLGVAETLTHLLRVEPEADIPPGLYAQYLATIKQRRDLALASWHVHTKPENAHVH